MPRKGYSPQFEDGRLNYFPVWIGDTLRHYTGELDYDAEILGIQVVLWCYSADQDPPGTLPNNPNKWARWTGKEAWYIKERMPVITSSWALNDNNRWEIQRIMSQARRAVDISGKRKAARMSRDSTHEGTQHGTSVPTSVRDTISNANANTRSNTKAKENSQPSIEGLSSATASDLPSPSEILNRKIGIVYKHYLTARGLDETTYALTPTRKQKIRSRLLEAKRRKLLPEEKYLCYAIDACLSDKFYTGSNDRNRAYLDLAKHILPTEEKFEEWLHEAGAKGIIDQ